MPIKYLKALCIILLPCLLVSCFSGRSTHKFKPYGKEITCFEPPPDVVARNAGAEISIAVKELGEILKAGAGVKADPEKIREVSVAVNDFEVLDFRICAQYGNELLPQGSYERFVGELLPLIKEGSAGKPTDTEARFDAELKEAKFFPFPGKDIVRAELIWHFRPVVKERNQAAHMIMGLAVMHDEALTTAGEAESSAKTCIEVPSCLGNRLWNLASNPMIIRGDSEGTTLIWRTDISSKVKLIRVWWEFYQREADQGNSCVIDESRKPPQDGMPFLKVVSKAGKTVNDSCYRAIGSKTVSVQ